MTTPCAAIDDGIGGIRIGRVSIGQTRGICNVKASSCAAIDDGIEGIRIGRVSIRQARGICHVKASSCAAFNALSLSSAASIDGQRIRLDCVSEANHNLTGCWTSPREE